MDKLNAIAKLLGEENERKLCDAIVDLLIEQVRTDLNDRYEYEYIPAFDDIYDEVRKQIEDEFKEKLIAKYRKLMDERLDKVI